MPSAPLGSPMTTHAGPQRSTMASAARRAAARLGCRGLRGGGWREVAVGARVCRPLTQRVGARLNLLRRDDERRQQPEDMGSSREGQHAERREPFEVWLDAFPQLDAE